MNVSLLGNVIILVNYVDEAGRGEVQATLGLLTATKSRKLFGNFLAKSLFRTHRRKFCLVHSLITIYSLSARRVSPGTW